MRRGNGPWELMGTVCRQPADPLPTVAQVGAEVRDRVVTYLPDAAPSFQPVAGGLVNLPTLFAAGEPESITTEPFQVLGFEVVVTADARWEWQFGEGDAQQFGKPGGAYPNDDVSFTYLDTGTRKVSVTTYWDASFTVDGQGPYPVPGADIAKTAPALDVPVREAASELVGG